MYKTINLKEIILGRIAARMNFSPMKLVASLHNSYYAKFIGISGEFDETATMNYPSMVNYDFTKIEKQAKYNVVDVEVEEVTDEIKKRAENARKVFKSKIKAQQDQYRNRRDNTLEDSEVEARETTSDDEQPLTRGQRPTNSPKAKNQNKEVEKIMFYEVTITQTSNNRCEGTKFIIIFAAFFGTN